MRHKVHPRALASIKAIWRHTARQWGEEQADAYVRGLYEEINAIAEKRALWRQVPDEHAPGVYCIRHAHHFVFFRELSGGQLGVIAVLHERMDIPNRLKECLDAT